jgi:hypothetical protein
MFKKQVSLMLISLKDCPSLTSITYKQWLRQACISRNTLVTHGGGTPIELAFGRRPADLTAIENMTPAQLTTRHIEALRSLAMRKFLEAKQPDDLRRDIASKLQLSAGPFFPGDKVYYWTEDKSKSNQTVHMEENGLKESWSQLMVAWSELTWELES